MALDERARRDLQKKLEEVLGEEQALTLMRGLPRDEPASRTDLELLGRDLGGRMDRLEKRMGGLEKRMDRLEDRMDETKRDLIAHIDGRFEQSVDRSLAQMNFEFAKMTRAYMFTTLSSVVAVGGLAVAAARFG